jgi:VCBS repeat protein
MPSFLPPRFFQQEASAVKVGALCTPFGVDWDGDGDEDLVVGDTAGYVSFVENLDGGDPPKWAAPVYLQADGEVIRIQAGPNGSIQGPCEAKWGYTAPWVADWNHDGALDVVVNSIWGEVLWYENVGTLTSPKLKSAQPVEVEWPGETPKPPWFWWNPKGKQLVTQWRTTPAVVDLNEDGLNDLVMLDTEGYLAFFERKKEGDRLSLMPGKRVFKQEDGELLRLNPKQAGGSGRRKFALADWDGDGRTDLLVNSRNINLLKNVAETGGEFVFKNAGELDDRKLAGHTTCPTVVDWDKNGVPDLLIGAEDGFLYHKKNPRAAP